MAAITGQAGAFWGPVRDEETGLIVPATAFEQESMTRQADNKTYTIDDSGLRYWDAQQPLQVEVSAGGDDWSVVTSGFTVQYAGGVIVFAKADAQRQVRVSGYAFELEEKLGFFSWSLAIDQTMHDATDFQSDGWVDNISGNRSWTAQAEQHWRNDEHLADWAGELLPVSFYVDDGATRKWRYEGVGYVSQDAVTTPQGDIVNRTLQFTGHGGVYRRIG